jgi:hypothetical protein
MTMLAPAIGGSVGNATYQLARAQGASNVISTTGSAAIAAHPDWSPVFDYEPAQAIRSRKAILDHVATNRVMVMGLSFSIPSYWTPRPTRHGIPLESRPVGPVASAVLDDYQNVASDWSVLDAADDLSTYL